METGETKQAAERAIDLKNQGNTAFAAKEYEKAVDLYSKAIEINPLAVYYGNRSAAWFELRRFQNAIDDCSKATELDKSFIKGFRRSAKAYRLLGDYTKSIQQSNFALGVDASDEESKGEVELCRNLLKADEAAARSDYADEYSYLLKAQKYAGENVSLALKIARMEVEKLRNYAGALRSTLLLIRQDPKNAEAYSIRGRALYLTEDYDQAIKHFQEALRLDPDHAEASSYLRKVRNFYRKMVQARDLARVRKFEEAIPLFGEALEADSENTKLAAILYQERAECHLRLNKLQECLADCRASLRLNRELIPAYLTRSTAFAKLENYEAAQSDVMHILRELDSNNAVAMGKVQTYEFEIRKRKRPDIYGMFGVKAGCSSKELKTGYKKTALAWHPDKHADKSPEERKKIEQRFKELQDAYSILTDPFTKDLWDQGFDTEAIKERVEMKKRREEAAKHGHGGGGCGCGSEGCGACGT